MDLNYITPLHERDEEDDNDIDDLEDSVFRAGHGQSNLLIGTKNSRRSDSQYSSLASSQDQSLISNGSAKGDCCTSHTSYNSLLHSLSHSSYSSLSDGSIEHIKGKLIDGYDISRVSLPMTVEMLPNHSSTWSRSADDVAKIRSPLLSSCYYRSDGHVDDVSESDGDKFESEQLMMTQNGDARRNICRNKAQTEHWSHSADSMIFVSDDDGDDDDGDDHHDNSCDRNDDKSKAQPCLIIYSSDKVECVESFV